MVDQPLGQAGQQHEPTVGDGAELVAQRMEGPNVVWSMNATAFGTMTGAPAVSPGDSKKQGTPPRCAHPHGIGLRF